MSGKFLDDIPMRTTSPGPRLCRTSTPINGTESANETDSTHLPLQSFVSSYGVLAQQDPDEVVIVLNDTPNQTRGKKKFNATSVFVSQESIKTEFSRCDGTTPKRNRPVAKRLEPIDPMPGSALSWKRKSREETSKNIQVASKKPKSDTKDFILFADDDPSSSFSTPCTSFTGTDLESTKSVPALIGELWTKGTKKYEARIQELEKERDRSTSMLVVYQRELQAAKQQSADFEARSELLEAEIATLKAGKARLEEHVGSTKKALEDLKNKFLVKVIQSTDEILTGFDEIGAQ
ncbi:hypothetical protein ARMSODRAFT_1019883 [Armillaria solidipes]|uniref:Uncharacterized protein n=1 Tax=Armillaria solidipes TaxID=1076256 RepID=A0A2H3BQH9_9AGAR|nr:hypothetical protein ARMSODRAFT_1019883 [Armillaria solidipes]